MGFLFSGSFVARAGNYEPNAPSITYRRNEFAASFTSTRLQEGVSSSQEQLVANMSPTESVDAFAPVLNVPAFCAFAVIAVVFGILQYRVTQIESAVDERQAALEELRNAKAAQLSGTKEGDDTIVQEATAAYTEAYWRVERLRTVVPGVIRIRAPVENAINTRGAQQFLGIAPPVPEDEDAVEEGSLAAKVSAVVLGIIALSQIGLLLLFATDPLNALNTLESTL